MSNNSIANSIEKFARKKKKNKTKETKSDSLEIIRVVTVFFFFNIMVKLIQHKILPS